MGTVAKILTSMAIAVTIGFSPTVFADQAKCKAEMEKRFNDINSKLAQKTLKNLSLSPDGATLSINGKIDESTAREFAAIPESKRSKIKFVMLNSPGGSAVAADPIANWVVSRFNSIKVVVPSGAICASACTTIFKCAWDRSAAEDSYLLFHPASMNQEGKDQLAQKWGPLGPLIGEAMANARTTKDENDECSKADQSSGLSSISKEVLKGREFCHRASELDKLYPNYLRVERAGEGSLLDGVSEEPGVQKTPARR